MVVINKLNIISLFRQNYLSHFHVREMAKLIKKSHVTLLPHIQALENDRIISPKTIGKNKVYSLNLNNIAAKNYMLLAEITEANSYLEQNFLIKKIISEIFNLNLTGAIALFGSYAKKTFNSSSDIDLFYLGKIDDDEIKAIQGIGKIYGKTINIKALSFENFNSCLRKNDVLIIEILKNHFLLQNLELFINEFWRYCNGIKRE